MFKRSSDSFNAIISFALFRFDELICVVVFQFDFLFQAKNVLSCITKIDSFKAKLTSEKHLDEENSEQYSTRQSIDERNNNSDYEEPCKRPKIDLGSCSPIYSVNNCSGVFFSCNEGIANSSIQRN